LLKEIFRYISDIATTVTFFKAMTILIVENKENANHLKDISGKFNSIEIKEKEK